MREFSNVSAMLVLLVFIWVSFGFAGQELPSDLEKNNSTQQTISSLKKKLFELQDANAMFMQNLAACAEENEELSAKLSRNCSDATDSEKKKRIVEIIHLKLQGGKDLGFLKKLDENDLGVLLRSIQRSLVAKEQPEEHSKENRR